MVTGSSTILVFDVNETLLDLSGMRPAFEGAFGTADLMGEWFARMLHGSLVANHLGRYRPFSDIGTEALVTLARKREVTLAPDDARDIVAGMAALPAHPDVIPAMERLRHAGYRLMTLTNGSTEVLADQLANSGIGAYIERAISVDEVGRFKPAPETYLMAAAKLDADLDNMIMVASHDWDILGARSVGIDGAFIDRPSVIWGSDQAPPAIVGDDLQSVADQIIGTLR